MMISIVRSLSLVVLLACLAHGAGEGTIAGRVKDPAGAPFRGAFVRARNAQTKITVMVLSDKQGQYRARNLPAGDYEVRATAVGYKDDLRGSVKVAAGETVSLDFALQNGAVRWSDLSLHQLNVLLPEGEGKRSLFGQCAVCHGLQHRVMATRRDAAGWTQAVQNMRDSLGPRLGMNDRDLAAVTSYLSRTLSPDSSLPQSPAELPAYQATVRSFGDEAMKVVYVDYELPGADRDPFHATPDKDGYVWSPYFGKSNSFARLDPATGRVDEFRVPKPDARVRSVARAPDGTVWIVEQGASQLAKFDPKTGAITEYEYRYPPGFEGPKGNRHTIRVDPSGMVWASAIFGPLSAFDPKTREFVHFREVVSPYNLEVDSEGSLWFVEFRDKGEIGKVDKKTGKVSKWAPPTSGPMRRFKIDSKGVVWFGEYRNGKIGRFDPKTEKFEEFNVPGPDPAVYALGIDRNDNVWYTSHNLDVLGRLDQKSGQITEYPFPYSGNTIKELFLDSQGRMWFSSVGNNKVGYFILQSE